MNIIELDTSEFTSYHDDVGGFKKAVINGLKRKIKAIPSKYLYDDNGSELFNAITKHPDYYLTNIDVNILKTYKKDILQLLETDTFQLIELGPGEGEKVEILFAEFLREKTHFTYIPIDISRSYLKQIQQKFEKRLSNLKILPIHADYFAGLHWLSTMSDERRLVLFLGSSIGNFTFKETLVFLKHLHAVLNQGDYLLFGFDLRKDIDLLLRAYNDSSGITRNFNLNILKRMNRELQTNFNVDKFQHYASYNAQLAAMESYLISTEKQSVYSKLAARSFHFDSYEPIHLEYSFKYTLPQITQIAAMAGFEVLANFIDDKQFFNNSLWKVRK